jgi:hypothetical protein
MWRDEWGQIFILYNPKLQREVGYRSVAVKTKPHLLLRNGVLVSSSCFSPVKGSKSHNENSGLSYGPFKLFPQSEFLSTPVH